MEKGNFYFNLGREELINILPRTLKVENALDVGCGEGVFGKILKSKFDCRVYGIEPDHVAAKKALENIDIVLEGFFEEQIENLNQKFDLVCFNDVLEHMVNPYEALRITHNYLRKEGMVQASIPNFLHFQEFFTIIKERDFRYSSKGIMDSTHLRWFTKKSMIRLFEENGYTVVKIQGLDPTPSRLMRLIDIFTLGKYSEMRYPQFAIQAKLK